MHALFDVFVPYHWIVFRRSVIQIDLGLQDSLRLIWISHRLNFMEAKKLKGCHSKTLG